MNYKNSDDSDMNRDTKNGDVSCRNGFTNIHTHFQLNESSSSNEMDGCDEIFM